MRISDWSSDVCSSDLQFGGQNPICERRKETIRAQTFLRRHVPDEPVRVAAGHRLAPIPHQPALFTPPIAPFLAFPLLVQFLALLVLTLHLCPAPAVEITRHRHQRHALPRNDPTTVVS